MKSEASGKPVSLLEEGAESAEKKWLTFWLEEQLFGVSITNVEQIVSMQPITAMPESPAYVKGVINLRGAMIPVLDLRMRLGKQEMRYTDHTCIIIYQVDGEQLGFIVDEVDAVIDIPTEAVSPPPKMAGDGVHKYLVGIARISDDGLREKMVLCLNAADVLREEVCQV